MSKPVEAVSEGKEIVIAKAGKPAARLVPIAPQPPLRKPGALKGRILIADDFDAPLPEDLQALFEGR
ncbi:MAG: type II toxin-antitoxin system Phd/YefM family antitoxin [Burkholderiaceae bacterium]